MATHQLKNNPVFHAGRKMIMHPRLKREIYSQTAVCYMRFLQKVKISYLELSATNDQNYSGRWVPGVPTHPAHLIISIPDNVNNCWKIIKEVDLSFNPKFAGEGLSQNMTIEEMESHFTKAMAEHKPDMIALEGIETDCIKVECDREHPVWPNHGEINGGEYNVPFGILNPLKAFGEEMEEFVFPVYNTMLVKNVIAPSAPAGMKINTQNPYEILFEGEKLSIGFSLVRPMNTSLTWDHFSKNTVSGTRLFFREGNDNGPSYITAKGDFCAQNMTGKVSVTGNQVKYINIDTGCGIVVNAIFTVNAESIILELEQDSQRDIPVIEGEAWRMVWNMRAGITGVAGLPAGKEGRNGFVDLPALITGDTGGCLSVRLIKGVGKFHTESYRSKELRVTSFILADYDDIKKPLVIPAGKVSAVFELKPVTLLPISDKKESELTAGIKRCWSAGFSAFRPEFGGFSNNAISTNCHTNQFAAFDYAIFTAKMKNDIDPLDLVKFSIGRALMDGGGYGYHRNLYQDSDPVLLSGAGRIFQLSEDRTWLESVKPGIVAATERIIGNFDHGAGMIISRLLSGNSGTYRWSSNAMDVIGFGYIDAYVNAWSFRALKNAKSILMILDEKRLANECEEIACAISANYAMQLINPETGWVSGWRSFDGNLHDYGFIWINGLACAFGVIEKAVAHNALKKLEEKRQEVFPDSGYLGLPCNLIPIKATDHMLARDLRYRVRPSYENYTDGSVSTITPGYYIRALSTNGFKKEASILADKLEQGFADGKFHGAYGTGKEMTTWAGADSGYEGTFGLNSIPLYAIGIERGVIVPPCPEWWLE